ncbi:ImmA/IrrE family metallo-endopeptidase [Halalkalibacterium halodurans]|uniref:ImmA/IrrE family metallo-endopeptidase n=1 Tax=Halalkalibacterium halodurans TaxID=86665 RepID=UPI002E24728A|nr:ImmA/IrrE family metallo-endopeptidase [Halalkalibacterium halodurans]
MSFTTFREDWLTTVYQRKGIQFVSDLSIHNISKLFNLKVKYYPYRSRVLYDENCALIFLQEGLPIEQRRYEFFHEFSHALQHVSDQRWMPKEFIRLQEEQAHRLALYASMPRYIIKPLIKRQKTVKAVAEAFQLPETFVWERVKLLKNQEITRYYYESLKHLEEKRNSPSYQGKAFKSSKFIISHLKAQVGEERSSYEVQSILRPNQR